MNWLIARIKEPSTAAGSGLVLISAGKAFEAIAAGQPVSAAVAVFLLGVAAILKGESK